MRKAINRFVWVFMKNFFRFLLKGFLSTCGLSVGVVGALSVIFIVFSLFLGSGDNALFVNLPNAQGEVQELGKTAPILAVIEINDALMSSNGAAKRLQSALQRLNEAPYKGRVKGLLIKMDCPGGEIFEVDRMSATLAFWKKQLEIPVHVFVSGLCASGGYHVACVADRIGTTSSALIGSIGVRSGPYFNVKEGLQRHGVETAILTAGQDKAPLNPFSPWTEEEYAERQAIVDAFYEQFVDHVVKNRPQLSKDRVTQVLGARVFIAKQALEEGLVDAVNLTQEQALEDLAEVCGAKETYRVIGLSSGHFLKRFSCCLSNSPLVTGKFQWTVLPDQQQKSLWYMD